jgi:hypothetical protein
MWARKNKNRPVLGFFTKTAYVQVMNFISVKVSTLYMLYSGFHVQFLNIRVNALPGRKLCR